MRTDNQACWPPDSSDYKLSPGRCHSTKDQSVPPSLPGVVPGPKTAPPVEFGAVFSALLLLACSWASIAAQEVPDCQWSDHGLDCEVQESNVNPSDWQCLRVESPADINAPVEHECRNTHLQMCLHLTTPSRGCEDPYAFGPDGFPACPYHIDDLKSCRTANTCPSSGQEFLWQQVPCTDKVPSSWHCVLVGELGLSDRPITYDCFQHRTGHCARLLVHPFLCWDPYSLGSDGLPRCPNQVVQLTRCLT